MSINNFDVKLRIKQHFNENGRTYALIMLFFILGLIVGVIFSVNGFASSSVLNYQDKLLYEFINGSASYKEIFSYRLSNSFLWVIFIFVFSLNYYLSFLSYLFVGYQVSLLVVSMSSIISLYGISGVLNSFLYVLPINLINIILMVMLIVFGVERAREQIKYNLTFIQSFGYTRYFKKFLVCVLAVLLFCIINSFVLPLLIKSFIIVNY